MEVKKITTREDLDMLYNSSALTIEGLLPECIPDFEKWFTDNGGVLTGVYQFSGDLMNSEYHLTGTNAYRPALNFVALTYSDVTPKIIFERFRFGGRWFDDIVDNNARRERESQED